MNNERFFFDGWYCAGCHSLFAGAEKPDHTKDGHKLSKILWTFDVNKETKQ